MHSFLDEYTTPFILAVLMAMVMLCFLEISNYYSIRKMERNFDSKFNCPDCTTKLCYVKGVLFCGNCGKEVK